MINIKKYTKIHQNQSGAVSMIVTILIMLLITLIVLAMSQNANNEQRQALDRQLSDQAFYNAESGINDTASYLYEKRNDTTVPLASTSDCNFKPYPAAVPNGEIDGPTGVNKYTCILYDKAPTTLVFDDVGTADSKVVPIEPAVGGLSNLTISWDDQANPNSNVSNCNFVVPNTKLPPSLPPGCEIGGVRVDLIPPISPAVNNRDGLNKATLSAFLLPGTSGGSLAFNGAYPENQGAIGIAKCSNASSRRCKITLNNIPPKFTLHIKSLYKGTDINIEGFNGAAVRFNNAQIMIDSTGRANDVLRRMQVRVPAQPQFRHAEFVIQAKDSVCKIIDVGKGAAKVASHPNAAECKLD